MPASTQDSRATLSKSKVASILGLLITALPFGVIAQGENRVSAGVSWSDNINKAEFNEVEDTIALIDLLVSQERESQLVDLSLEGSVGFRHFIEGSYDDEVVGDLVGTADFGIWEEYIRWLFDVRFETLMLDPYRPDVPLNRDNLLSYSTGPDLAIPVAETLAIEVGGRYRVNNFEDSNTDNEVVVGLASLVKRLSQGSRVSLNFNHEEVDYDIDSDNTDYSRERAYLGFERENAKGRLILNAGGNRLEIDGETYEGFYGVLRIDKNLTARSIAYASIQHSYSDTSDEISLQLQNPGIEPGSNVTDVVVSGDPFEGRNFEIGISHDRYTSSWQLSAEYSEQDYVNETSIDRSWYSVEASFSKMFGGGWRVGGEAEFRRGELYEADRIDNDTELTIGLARYLSRFLDVELAYTQSLRNSSEETQDYKENRVTLTLGYSPRPN